MDALLGKTLSELQEVALQAGLPRFAGKQIAEWLYQKRVVSFDEMTNISLKGRETLRQNYVIGRTMPAAEALSQDGTKKYLFTAEICNQNSAVKKEFIESVYIPDADRATLCVSTQAGCKMGCKFCMTGTLGFHGHLSAADILNQVFSIPDSLSLTNIVYMGEGEPCDNIDAVLRSVEVLTASWGCGWSPHRITVSSVGFLPGLKRLLDESECHVAISLHNPFPEERAELMPIEQRYGIEEVLRLIRQYDWSHQRRISFEYICFGGKNETPRHGAQLRSLLRGLNCRVNLIRFHASPVGSNPLCPPTDATQMQWLCDYLNSAGITTTIRRSRGEDILAACGMLVNSLQS